MSREVDEPGITMGARVLARLTENWSLKVISVVVSIALYVVLHGGGDSQRTIDVDIFERVPEDGNVVQLRPLPSRVRVTVQGPRALLDELTNNVEPVTIDITKQPDKVYLKDIDYKLPTGVKPIGWAPLYIDLKWDIKVTKSVPVEVTWTAPPEGLALKNLSTTPSTVSVTGPKLFIDVLQRLRTEGIQLTHLEPGHYEPSLVIDLNENPALANMQLGADSAVKLDVDRVVAKFDLVPETKTRVFPNLFVLAMGGKGVTLRPSKVAVTVTCLPKRADALVADAIVPKIDLESLGPDFAKKGPEEADVKLDIPGCSEVTISPPRVAVSR
ncbi:MAG: hypothetical protein ABI175_02710 [Polyangiales bacterium]